VLGTWQYPFSVTVKETIFVSGSAMRASRAGGSSGATRTSDSTLTTRLFWSFGPNSTAVKAWSCGASLSRMPGDLRLAPTIPQSPPLRSMASSITSAPCDRKKAPSPRCTIPGLGAGCVRLRRVTSGTPLWRADMPDPPRPHARLLPTAGRNARAWQGTRCPRGGPCRVALGLSRRPVCRH